MFLQLAVRAALRHFLSITPDGRFLGLHIAAEPGGSCSAEGAFLWDRVAARVETFAFNSAGQPANGSSSIISVSNNGRESPSIRRHPFSAVNGGQ